MSKLSVERYLLFTRNDDVLFKYHDLEKMVFDIGDQLL